jgi:L-methionine (R)-S-oxide reductase
MGTTVQRTAARLDGETRRGRYERVTAQLEERFADTPDPVARMATAAALLHHKMTGFFWTGFYLLRDGELTVGPYQGTLACLVLEAHTGVCWAGIDRGETVLVPDVHAFPGHIACDSRSNSEIVVPLRDDEDRVVGVLDVDSTRFDNFDAVDAECLERIVALIYQSPAAG